ncbi:hypothetical protein F4808DRAFT_419991 [Astrocystis sublimbata]|nr:hypothetical protein F4808DRAFT_419991 [Astrocystis sublimbata]
MTRTIYLIIYNNPLFPAHWALWIPSPSPSPATTTTGKRIHIEGDAATGFQLSFDRAYDTKFESRKYKIIFLAEVDDIHVSDDDDDNTPRDDGSNTVVDQEPQDTLERIAASVPPPEPSLVSAADRGTRGTKVEIKNCQTWLVDVVDALHNAGIFDSSAVQTIRNAPKN